MLSALPIATTVAHDGVAFLRPHVSSVYDPVGHVSRSSGRLSLRSVGRRSSGRSVGARKSVCRRKPSHLATAGTPSRGDPLPPYPRESAAAAPYPLPPYPNQRTVREG